MTVMNLMSIMIVISMIIMDNTPLRSKKVARLPVRWKGLAR